MLERYSAQTRPGPPIPRQSYLLEALHDAQGICGGWLPRVALEHIAYHLQVPSAEVYGVTEFYSMFHTRPVANKVIRVCRTLRAMAGSESVEVRRHLRLLPGGTSSDGASTLEPVRCLGLCDRAPAALVNLERHAPADPAHLDSLLSGSGRRTGERLRIGGLVKVALPNVGVVDPTSLEDYRAQGGLAALRKALREMNPPQVISELKASKLVGRGGAAFLTGLKWELATRKPGPRHLICNADESEPGTFKDRVLMDNDPFRVVEGLIIAFRAGWADSSTCAASTGWGTNDFTTQWTSWSRLAAWARTSWEAASTVG
jgi:NADH-quinone oxidoreductase subunit F